MYKTVCLKIGRYLWYHLLEFGQSFDEMKWKEHEW